MSGKNEAGDEGFTLVEVLVAFAILALVSLAMMRAFAGTTQTLKVTTEREMALDVALDVLELTRAQIDLSPGRQEGGEGMLRWWREVADVTGVGSPPPPGAPRLFRVAVGVAPSETTASRVPLLTTLVLAAGSDE